MNFALPAPPEQAGNPSRLSRFALVDTASHTPACNTFISKLPLLFGADLNQHSLPAFVLLWLIVGLFRVLRRSSHDLSELKTVPFKTKSVFPAACCLSTRSARLKGAVTLPFAH